MALTDENGMSTTMLVQPTNGGFATPYPVYQNSGNGGNSNGFGNDGW